MSKDCITINHNPSGQQGDNFSFTHEYAYFLHLAPGRYIAEQNRENEADWDERNFRDVTGEESLRSAGKNCFYPILIKDGELVGFGDVCNDDYHPTHMNVKLDNNLIAIYPVDPKGIERKWRFARNTVESIKHELRAHRLEKRDVWDIKRLKKTFNYKSNWVDTRYSANNHGTQLLNHIIPAAPASYPKSLYTVRDCVHAALNGSTKSAVLDYFAGSGTTGHAVIKLNREDNGQRKYVLVEQGEYFDTVLKPRIQKVIYSADWKEGKATAPHTGISHAFKVLKIESYEDTLNNLQLRRTIAQQSLLDDLPTDAQEDYLLRYLLDIESRGSLLSVEQFNQPFDCKLKVTVDSAGAYEERAIDLVETFNYLIGLRVKHIDTQRDKGFVTVTGWLPTGEKTLVLWRDVSQVDYETLNRLCDRLAINPADSEFAVVYINGDHNIPAVFTSLETEGGIEKKLKIRQIEPEFLSRMFAVEGV
ncbi:Type III restriction-modification system methylation subunit [Candidatus Methylobacter favarea]|uniref:Type III restriction-modification system methylation subunit n=2 Tax=Candidatus Methylobacter favarea TaxID=2707345 RepID=A0A8S0XTX2_9GAMM|nr:Type III restriction-modification system methylation subunit [Candidatus Methylobacter favarea]